MKKMPDLLKLFQALVVCMLVKSVFFVSCDSIELKKEAQISTGSPSELTDENGIFVVEGEIIEIGNLAITQFGHCWGLSSEPTIFSPDTTSFFDIPPSRIFQSRLRRLRALEKYYVRAYVQFENGEVLYSNPDSITKTPLESALEMIPVQPGSLILGGEEVYELPATRITLDTLFAIGKYEVTQHLWEIIIGGINTSFHQGCPDCPVEKITPIANGVDIFIRTLNRRTGRNFRLPTEAEWEYAARGGVLSKGYDYAGSDDPYEVGWYKENVPFVLSQPIGMKKPNELGIYDMSGNIREICSDIFDESYYRNRISIGDTINPKGPLNPVNINYRSARGGAYSALVKFAKNGSRQFVITDGTVLFPDSGFRLAEDIE